MGLTISKLFAGMLGKKEMREYTVCLVRHYLHLTLSTFSRYINGLYTTVSIALFAYVLNGAHRSDWMLLVKRPFCTSSSLARS